VENLPVNDVAVVSIKCHQTCVYVGDLAEIDVTIKNEGNFVDNVSITLYADKDAHILLDEFVIGTVTVFGLQPGTEKSVTFSWNTTGVPS